MSVGRRLLVSLGIVAALVGFVVQPWFTWPCPLRVVCGLPCPTCGMTRAAKLAMGGHFGDAMRMHPLWFVVLPLVCGLLLVELAVFVRTGARGTAARITRRREARVVVYATFAAVLVVWIARFFGAFGGPVQV